jgi:hypothetical protein
MTSMIYGREYLYVVWVHTEGRNAWGEKNQVLLKFSFLFLGILRDERLIFLKSSIFQTRDRQKQKIFTCAKSCFCWHKQTFMHQGDVPGGGLVTTLKSAMLGIS